MNMQALIIDDSKIFHRLLENVLDDLGMHAVFARTAADALAQVEQHRFDLICVDQNLTDADGLRTCSRLRELANAAMVPIILLVADEESVLDEQGFDAGVTEVVPKSNLQELHRSLRDFVSGMQHQLSGKVLLVEDSATSAQMMRFILEKMHLEVDHELSAEAAFERFCSEDYDLVITDIVLEGAKTGLGLLRDIRAKDEPLGTVPVLGISALDDTARRIEMLRQGANDYVAKPVVEEEFAARVRNLVTNKQLFDQVRAQQEELRRLSVTDQLTGLYNKRYLSEAAPQFFSNALRHGTELCLMIIDLDHFKAVNDTHGHDIGDKVLMAVGGLLRETCRGGDVPARFGGEEFVVLMPHCGLDNAIEKAERLRVSIEKLHPAGLSVTASIGVAERTAADAKAFDALFREADQAVYSAKGNGRNQVVAG